MRIVQLADFNCRVISELTVLNRSSKHNAGYEDYATRFDIRF